VEISILSESEIEIYPSPGTKLKQRVITYQAEGLAPRTVWIDSVKLPDAVYAQANPGKPIPADVQAKGDAIRRAAAEADIAKIKAAPAPRKI
jgi:hypothetical protein